MTDYKHQGLIPNRYQVRKGDGSPLDPDARVFVLRYDKDDTWGVACRMALRYFAEHIVDDYPQLSRDLQAELDHADLGPAALVAWARRIPLEAIEDLLLWAEYSEWMSAIWLCVPPKTNSLEEYLAENPTMNAVVEWPDWWVDRIDLDLARKDVHAVRAQIAKARAIRAEHLEHGRGTAEDGPDDLACPCTGHDGQGACARAGCGFCRAAGDR